MEVEGCHFHGSGCKYEARKEVTGEFFSLSRVKMSLCDWDDLLVRGEHGDDRERASNFGAYRSGGKVDLIKAREFKRMRLMRVWLGQPLRGMSRLAAEVMCEGTYTTRVDKSWLARGKQSLPNGKLERRLAKRM